MDQLSVFDRHLKLVLVDECFKFLKHFFR